MFYKRRLVVIAGLAIIVLPFFALGQTHPPQLEAMVSPLQEVETMLADGTYTDGEFSESVSNRDAAAFAKKIRNKLRTAKSEYARLPRAIRLSKAADQQWYRMDALLKTSKGFSKALRQHAQAKSRKENSTTRTASTPIGEPGNPGESSNTLSQADSQVEKRKRAAEARKEALRAQQQAIRARAARVKAEKQAAAAARAAGVAPRGPEWQNSYIPNIAELESRDGFFAWPWSTPSWQAVMQKAEQQVKENKLGPTQVKLFSDFVLDKADEWPDAPRVDDAGDAQYALDMIAKREAADGLDLVDLWISRSDWKIQRNSLGVILSRSKPGYLLYKDPGGTGCILKQLWIKEPYTGGSRFEKTSNWRYARIRFQSCERR
jgi:hypothetical protein